MKNIFSAVAQVAVVLAVLFAFGWFFYNLFSPYTAEEIAIKKERCAVGGQDLYVDANGLRADCVKKKDSVSDCLDRWVSAIDEKYNNPDTVSDLRDTEYDKVVRQCQETFGTK